MEEQRKICQWMFDTCTVDHFPKNLFLAELNFHCILHLAQR